MCCCFKNRSARGRWVKGYSRFDHQSHRFWRSLQHRVLVHHRHRRLLAAAQAGRGDHPHLGAQDRRQSGQQPLGACQLAAQAVAHPHSQGRAWVIAAQHLEVVVERGHLVHLGQRQVHGSGQCRQVALVQASVRVVELVQVLDQQVAPVRRRPHQRPHFTQRGLVGLAPFQLTFFADALAHVVDAAQRDNADGRGWLGQIHRASSIRSRSITINLWRSGEN